MGLENAFCERIDWEGDKVKRLLLERTVSRAHSDLGAWGQTHVRLEV